MVQAMKFRSDSFNCNVIVYYYYYYAEIILQCYELEALLLLDSTACHPDEKHLLNGEMKAYTLLPNVTLLIQSLQQGILENL